MWDKFAQLTAIAGMTCMMRASVGDILSAPGGREAFLALYAECRAVAVAAGFPST
jgi:2-dehydropantoate 2-reductase